ncbi:hypothetical protein V8D89_007160 [Ganoderma adspersum]
MLSRQWTGELRWKPRWHRRHASESRVTQHAHSALFCCDVLIEVFAVFDLNDRVDVTACARSAQVCLAWTGPASEMLWTSCSGRSLKDLDYLLRAIDVEIPGGKFLPEVLTSNKHRRRRDAAWALFLQYGEQVRALRKSDYKWWDDPATVKGEEGALVHYLIRRNQGRTFLPSLQSADWEEHPESRGALFSLIPHSLGSLDLTLHWSMSKHDIEAFMAQLASTVPGLHSLRLTTAPNVSIERLSYPPHLRHLSRALDALGNALSLPKLQALVSRLQLETLSVQILGSHTWHGEVCGGKALRKLHVEGGCRDLAALVSHLHAPALRELDIRVKDPFEDSPYEPAEHHGLSVALGGNTRLLQTLRSLTLAFRPWCSSPESSLVRYPGPPVPLFSNILAPLVQGLTGGLEALIVEHWHEAVSFTDDEVVQLAQAFPLLKRLTLSVGARTMCLRPPSKLPSVSVLYHVAQYCQQLRELEIELADDFLLASQLNWQRTSSPMADGTPLAGHPLQTLELTVWMPVGWRGGGARDEFRSYANKIFPNRYRDKEIFLVRYPAHWWTS